MNKTINNKSTETGKTELSSGKFEAVRNSFGKIGEAAASAGRFFRQLGRLQDMPKLQINIHAGGGAQKESKPKGFPLSEGAKKVLRAFKERNFSGGIAGLPDGRFEFASVITVQKTFSPMITKMDEYVMKCQKDHAAIFDGFSEAEAIGLLSKQTGYGEKRVLKLIHRFENAKRRKGSPAGSHGDKCAAVLIAFLSKKAMSKTRRNLDSILQNSDRLLIGAARRTDQNSLKVLREAVAGADQKEGEKWQQ